MSMEFTDKMRVFEDAVEYGRVTYLTPTEAKKKAAVKRSLLADFKKYRKALFPDFDWEPDIRWDSHQSLTPVRVDREPLSDQDHEIIAAYFTAVHNDEDYVLPYHLKMAWGEVHEAGWFLTVPNEFITK